MNVKGCSGVLLLCVVAASSVLQAEQISFERPSGKADLPVNVVYVVNRGSQAISFGLSLSKETWETFRLAPAEGRVARAIEGETTEIFIKLRTGSKNVLSRMQAGGRYQIYWNGTKKLWDVTKLSER